MKKLARLLSARDVVVLAGLVSFGAGRYLVSPAAMLVEVGAILMGAGLFRYLVDGVRDVRGLQR